MTDNMNNNYKEDLYDLAGLILNPSKYGQYECPFCGSGTGRHKTGAFSIHRGRKGLIWKCHACGAWGDTLELIGLYYGLDKRGQYLKAKELFGK